MTGSSAVINGAMWFQVVLFLSTAFYMVCYHLFKEKALNISIILGIVALIIQYTGINERMWKWLPWEYELTLARLVEMLPYVSTGMLIGKNISKLQEIRDKFSRKRRMLLTIMLCIFEVIIGESRRYHIVDVGGYSYSGVLLIVRAILLVIAFYLLPIDMISGKKKRLICVCTAYTLGIYCLHNCVGLIGYIAIEWLGYNREMYSMVKSICVYAFCYFLSWLIAHLPWKWCRKLVE